MRGVVAKRIRRLVYGDNSLRGARPMEWSQQSGGMENVRFGRRRVYLAYKCLHKSAKKER